MIIRVISNKKHEFRKKEILNPDVFLKQSDSSLLAEITVLRLIVYLKDSNITVLIKLSVESNITGK